MLEIYFVGQTAVTRSEQALSPTDTGMLEIYFVEQTAVTPSEQALSHH
jgi:hypothetical protein